VPDKSIELWQRCPYHLGQTIATLVRIDNRPGHTHVSEGPGTIYFEDVNEVEACLKALRVGK